jgi:hypothetical protein
MPIDPTSMIVKSIAARSRPNTLCAYPGSKSEVTNARRGLIGGRGVESGRDVGCACVPGTAMPARALSLCCARAERGTSESTQNSANASEMAGECGNRTHPTLRGKVTVILKITEATRPHPPPLFSVDLDRNFSPVDDLANQHCSGNT